VRIAVVLMLLAGVARAEVESQNGLVVVDRGEKVDVIVRGSMAATGPATSVGDRVEIPLADLPMSALSLRSADATVGRVEILPGPKPRLSIALHHGRDTTAKIAGAAEIVTAPEGFRVTLLRSSALKSYVKPPEAIAPPPPAAEIKPIEPIAAPAAAAIPAPVPAPTVAASVATAAPAAAPAPAPALGTIQSQPAAPIAGTQTSSDIGGARLAALAIGLIACAVLLFVARKRRGTTAGADIRVIASQSLGGKHRVVLVAAGKREFLLALSEKGTSVIARWRTQTRAIAEPQRIDAPARPPMITATEKAILPAALPPASPAVAGLLKLRKTSPSPSGTPQNDLEWAARLARARAAGSDA